MIKNSLNLSKSPWTVFLLSLTFLICSLNLYGQTWTGNVSNSWHHAGNWDSGRVPASGSVVTIRSVSPKPFPVITSNVTVRTINLPDWSTGELTVTNKAVLTVTETFNINNHGKLILDNGTLQFEGNGNGNRKINMGWTNTGIHIKNKGKLNSPNAQFDIVGEIIIEDGSMNLGNGMQLNSGKLIRVTEGEINVYGTTGIQGTIDGGNGKFIFNGKPNDEFSIKSGGSFYMAPAKPSDPSPECIESTPDNPTPSGGTVEVHTVANIYSSGYFYGGNADVRFYKSTSLTGTAVVETHNGLLHFSENLTAGSASINLTCKGTIKVDGTTTLRSSAFLNAYDGNIYLGGNLRTESNSAEINAGNSTIHFFGSTFVNEGYFNPGTSTFIFNAIGSQIVSTHSWRENITFYNLIAEGTADVQATHNILVLNDMSIDDNSEFNVDAGKTLNVVGNVTGDPFVDTNRPYIISIRINAPNSITAIFNEALNRNSAQNAGNYRIENESGQTISYPTNPRLEGTGNNEVTLTLGFNIVEKERYYLISNNILNLRGYSTNTNHRKRFELTEPLNRWTWTGKISSDWNNVGNWVKNLLPAQSSDVVIPVTPHNPVISSTGNIISTLVIHQGAALTIGSRGSLTVTNTLENNAGTGGLIIASDPAGTGSLIHNTNSVPATFQRYISGAPQHWQMLSSPVTNQSISGNFTPTGGNNPYGDGTRYDFYAWYEPDTSWVYLLNDYQQPTWQTANGGNTFVPGRGYLVSYKDEHPTRYFEGNLNNGPVSIPVTKTNGTGPEFSQNLVGNPYPSSIDWKATSGWTRNRLATKGGGYELWIWSETHLNYGAYNSASSSNTGTLGVTRHIAPNQGFFVKASGSGTLSMDNRIRVHEGAANWLKSAALADKEEKIMLTVHSESVPGGDQVVVEFGHEKDEEGTVKKFSFIPAAPSMFIPDKGSNYSIRMVDSKEKNPVMPLSFKAGTTGYYQITADVPAGAFDFLELHDKLTGIRHDLLDQQAYTFQAGVNDNPDRFILQVVPGQYADPHNTLPVNMHSSQQTLYVDMRLLSGKYSCNIYNLMGQPVSKNQLIGGDVCKIRLPSGIAVVIVQIKGEEGYVYKKVPVM